MKKTIWIIIICIAIAVLIIAGVNLWNTYKGLWYANKPSSQNIVQLIQNSQTSGVNQTKLPLSIPDGYTLSIYAQNLSDPRVLVADPNGVVLVSLTSAGKVVAIVNGVTTDVVTGLNQPHGLAFNGNKLYIAEVNEVAIYDYNLVTHKATNKQKIIDLPGGGLHFTRTLLITGGKLYVSIGSSCNACIESDPRYASIYVANLDGTDFKPYAIGLRNAVFMTTNPNTDEIWATVMGRDYLGDNVPPDIIDIVKDGANYGWPYCYGNKIIDQSINPGGKKFDCSMMMSPQIQIQAHSAPLGLAFLGNDLLVSYHGSWNRTVPTGYKVVLYHLDKKGNLISGPTDFISGWLQPNGDVLGRPVAILIKGSDIYISDDKAGVIYLLEKQ